MSEAERVPAHVELRFYSEKTENKQLIQGAKRHIRANITREIRRDDKRNREVGLCQTNSRGETLRRRGWLK